MNDAQMTNVHVQIGPAGRQPLYATPGSAGCDLYAAAEMILLPGETRVLPLDMVMALEPGVEAQIRPRSGLSLQTDLRLPNAPGTIDSDYRHQVGVILQNTFSMSALADRLLTNPDLAARLAGTRQATLADYLDQRGQQEASRHLRAATPELADRPVYLDEDGLPFGTIRIKPGERIAQMIFTRVLQATFINHDDPASIGNNRGGGFGSTGKG